MAERAHPQDPSFNDKWKIQLKYGFIPWIFKKGPYRKVFEWRYKWVNQYMYNKDILDIPCGMGWGTSMIKNAKSITGVDISEEAIAEAKSRYGKKILFKVGSMDQLDFPNHTFDVVSCLEGIEHVTVETAKSFLKESQRVLRANGKLLISSPYCQGRSHSGNPYHIYEYQPNEIKNLISQLFDIDSIITKRIDIMTVLYIVCSKK